MENSNNQEPLMLVETDDLYAIPGYYKRLKEMEERLEIKQREINLEEAQAWEFARNFRLR